VATLSYLQLFYTQRSNTVHFSRGLFSWKRNITAFKQVVK